MTDSPDYRQYLEEKFHGFHKLMNAQFEIVYDKLDAIEKQTTKTNGRVTILENKVDIVEKDLLTHPMNCNQAKEIEKIGDVVKNLKITNDIIEKLDMKKDRKIGTWILIAGFIVALMVGIHQIKLIRQQMDGFGVPFVKNARGEFIALPDSTRIVFFPNDSVTYTIKKIIE